MRSNQLDPSGIFMLNHATLLCIRSKLVQMHLELVQLLNPFEVATYKYKSFYKVIQDLLKCFKPI